MSDSMKGYSFRIKSPEGIATIGIYHNVPLQVEYISYNIGKAGSMVAAWCNALARITIFALKNTSLDEVIAELSDIASDRVVQTIDGVACRSGPEALAMALKLYKIHCYRDTPTLRE